MDGWELNNEFFPSPHDHQKPMSSRINEFCGQKKIKQVFISSQNVALIQYRMPIRGTSFSFSVRFVKNPTRKQYGNFYKLKKHNRFYFFSVQRFIPKYGRHLHCPKLWETVELQHKHPFSSSC